MVVIRKKSLFSIVLTVALILTSVTPVFAAYEQDSYIKLSRTLDPNQTTVEAGSEQDINYHLTGDENEFELDPALVNTNYLLQKNIALVLDISGSMDDILDPATNKTRLAVLKESVNKFLDYFENSNTKISIIPFADNANMLTPLKPMNDPASVSYLRDFVHTLFVMGGTNIGDGMRRAYWQLKYTPKNSVNYVIVMTDGEPNLVTRAPGGTFYLGDFYAPSTANLGTDQATNYAMAVGGLIAEAKFTSYFVGLTNEPSVPLEKIAQSANAAVTTPGNHYYKVIDADDMINVFSNILVNEIASTLPMQVNVNETLPSGVEVVNLPDGLTQSVLGDGRVQISGQITNISLQKNDVTGKYSITPWNETIRVKYTTVGVKNFDSTQVTYVDPFGNSKTAEILNPIAVQVIDTTAPTVPILSLVQTGGDYVELSWTASSDNVGVAGYNIYRDGALAGTTAGTAFTVVGLTENTNYSFTVTAFDAAGNESAPSNVIEVLTPDVSAPSAPTDLHLVSKSSSSVTIAWSASTDNVGVTGYNIYRDGVLIGTVTELEYTDSGLTKGQTYQYTVTAVDNAGNESAPSSPIAVMLNNAPIANAGSDATVEATSPAGALVTLNGSGSSDPESDPLTFTWSGPFGTVSGETPTVQLPLGTHTITLTVSDGDLSSSDTVVIQVVDTTPPEITGTRSPEPNINGWYNTDVTVHFTASDSGSGILSVTPDIVVSTEGANQSVTGTAVDVAGNSASTTVGGISIDKTGPAIVDATLASGSYKTTDTIVIDFTATDDLSGLDSVVAKLNGAVVRKGQSISLQSKAGSNVLEITATDKAGNVTVKTLSFAVDVNVNVDIKPETLNPKSQGEDNSITTKIEFPTGFIGASIDLQTIKLSINGSSISAQNINSSGGGSRSFTVKFNRQDLIALIGNRTGTVTLTLTGNISGGAGFVGSGTINVLPK